MAPGGSKSWIQRLTIEGRRHDIGLGPFPVIGLAEARKRAFANRVASAHGGNPLAEKRRAKSPTFREAAERTFEATKARWRNAKTPKMWRSTLEKRAFPVFGDRRLDTVTREDVLRVVAPLWSSKPKTARRLRGYIQATLSWCQAHGFIAGDNVAGESIDGGLPSMPVVKQHLRALRYSEVGVALETVQGDTAAKLCLRFVVLTAVRSGEARGGIWSEVDLEAREWRMPASRMKAGGEHRVPLSAAAVAVLEHPDSGRRFGLAVPVSAEAWPVPARALV